MLDERIRLIPGHLSTKEMHHLEHHAKENKNGVIVEIGSFKGRSSAIIASCIENAEFYAIDTWMNDGMYEGQSNVFFEFKKNVAPWKEKIIPLRMRSEDAAYFWHKSIDMLFIDGDHTYPGVLKDLQNWYKFLKPGGDLLMHDFTYHRGVQAAADEFFGDAPEYKVNSFIAKSLLKMKKPL